MEHLGSFNYFFILYLCLLISFPGNFTNSEFYFSKSSDSQESPSYLIKKFSNITEVQFPAKFELTFSLSSLNGMLLTSLDQFKNSLLIQMRNKNIRIYYNEEFIEISLNSFCNCKRGCLDEKIKITVFVKDKVKFQCNNGKFYELKIHITNRKKMTKPYFIFPRSNVSNQAVYYLINLKSFPFRRTYSNQLTGCIFEVKYKDKLIKMEKKGKEVEEGCPRRCKGSESTYLCNSGECIETHSKYNVFCNCSKSIYKGPRCNETVQIKVVTSSSVKTIANAINQDYSYQTQSSVILYLNQNGPVKLISIILLIICLVTIMTYTMCRLLKLKPRRTYVERKIPEEDQVKPNDIFKFSSSFDTIPKDCIGSYLINSIPNSQIDLDIDDMSISSFIHSGSYNSHTTKWLS